MTTEQITNQLPELNDEEVRFIMEEAGTKVLSSRYAPFIEQQSKLMFACSMELAKRGGNR